MRKTQIQGLSFVLLLASLPLISIGATAGVGVLWGTGLILLALGGLVLTIARYPSMLSAEEKGREGRKGRRETRRKGE